MQTVCRKRDRGLLFTRTVRNTLQTTPSQCKNGENVCAGAFDKISELMLIEEFENGEKLEMKCINGLVPSMFERNANDYPNTTAVYVYGREITYYNLNKMASPIARYLKMTFSQKCLKTRPIILFMEKSENVIAAILGIWKAGGYFLPVSLISQSALKETIQQADATVVITNIRKEFDGVDLSDKITVTDVADILRRFDFCFTALQHILGHFGCGQLP